VETKSFESTVNVELPSAFDTASIQLSNGPRAAEFELVDGQSVELKSRFSDGDAGTSNIFGGQRIESESSTSPVTDFIFGGPREECQSSTFTVTDLQGKKIFGGDFDLGAPLNRGQVIITKYSVNSKSGKVVTQDIQTLGVELDEKFVKYLVSSIKTEPKAELLEPFQPIELPIRGGATTTTTLAPIELPIRGGATTTTTTVAPTTTTSPPVAPAPLTITAVAVAKFYGDADPELTYTSTGFVNGDTAAVLTGTLTRVAGENAGTYAINQGSLAAPSNYTVSFTGANLTITARPLTVTVSATSPISEGATVQATATSSYPTTGQVSWSASPSSVCTVSATGLITGVTAGDCVVVATFAAAGNYQQGLGNTTVQVVAAKGNCGGGNGVDPNTPGCGGGGRNETTTTTVAPTTTTTVAPTTTTTTKPPKK